MLGSVEDGIPNYVMAMNSFILGRTSNCVVTKCIRVFSARWTLMCGIVDLKAKPITKSDAKVLRDDRETESRIRDSVQKGTRLRKAEGQETG